MTRTLLILITLLSGLLAHGATNYVRAGATSGTKGGTNWANAFTNIPITMTRGDTYYVAEGNYGYVGYGGFSYGAYEFNDNLNGSTITLRKATVADHGTATGWDNAYGDGQAVFIGGVTFWDGSYVIDGNGRNESNWQDGASYGFYMPSITVEDANNFQMGSDVTLRHIEFGDPYNETEQSGYGTAVKVLYSRTNWVFSQCYFHNYGHAEAGLHIGGGSFLVESNFFGPGWGKEAIRGVARLTNSIIRYNVFRDAIQTATQDDPEGAGMTAEIAIWDDGSGPSFKDLSIYGNVFTNRFAGTRNGVILLGPWDSSANLGDADRAKVYNNTFIGVLDTTAYAMVKIVGADVEVKNNLFYNCAESDVNIGESTGSSVAANNLAVGSNVFSGFTITAALPGTSLSSPYNRDPLGVTRGADGVFDIGAYEFDSEEDGGGEPASGATLNVGTLFLR